MTITDEIRKTVTTATYAAAGTADLAAEKLRELRSHAPSCASRRRALSGCTPPRPRRPTAS